MFVSLFFCGLSLLRRLKDVPIGSDRARISFGRSTADRRADVHVGLLSYIGSLQSTPFAHRVAN